MIHCFFGKSAMVDPRAMWGVAQFTRTPKQACGNSESTRPGASFTPLHRPTIRDILSPHNVCTLKRRKRRAPGV